MEIVRHSTLDMTMRVYGHVSLDAQRNTLGRLGDLLDEDEDEDRRCGQQLLPALCGKRWHF